MFDAARKLWRFVQTHPKGELPPLPLDEEKMPDMNSWDAFAKKHSSQMSEVFWNTGRVLGYNERLHLKSMLQDEKDTEEIAEFLRKYADNNGSIRAEYGSSLWHIPSVV